MVNIIGLINGNQKFLALIGLIWDFISRRERTDRQKTVELKYVSYHHPNLRIEIIFPDNQVVDIEEIYVNGNDLSWKLLNCNGQTANINVSSFSPQQDKSVPDLKLIYKGTSGKKHIITADFVIESKNDKIDIRGFKGVRVK